MKSKFLAVFAFVLPVLAVAQSDTEIQFWSEVGAKRDLSKHWNASVAVHYRYAPYAFSLDRAIVEAQIAQKVNKRWKRSLEVRNYTMYTPRTEETALDQRLRLRYSAERSFNKVHGDLSVRAALQHRLPLVGGGNQRTTLRLRTSYEYPVPNFKWDPEFQVEYLHDLNNNFERCMRVGIGSGRRLVLGKGSLGYFYERNFTNSDPHRHVLQWSYTLM